MTDYTQHQDYIKIKDFIENCLNVSKNPVEFDMKLLFEHDYKAFEFLCNHYNDIKDNVFTMVRLKRTKMFEDTEININFIPYKQMVLYEHKKCNPYYLGKIYYLKGTIIGLSDPYIQRLFVYTCTHEACPIRNREQFEPSPRQRCSYCNQRISNPIILRTCWVELVIMDEKNSDNQIICRTQNMNDPEINIVYERDNILGKKVELTITPFEVPEGKKCIYHADIVGVTMKEFSELTPERRKRATEIIEQNKENLIQVLINEITPQHYKHELIKTMLLLILVSLRPINFAIYGNAGIGKSKLVLWFMEYIQNSCFITSQTSVAGALVGIDTANGSNRLILGKLPLAHNSVALFDEMSSQEKEIQNAIQHIMSEKKIVYSKIRSFTMDINVSLIFCCNAKNAEARFDPEIPFYNQLDISYPLMSRCHAVTLMHSAGLEGDMDTFGQYLLRNKKLPTQYTKQEIQDVVFVLRNKPEKKISESAYQILIDGWKDITESVTIVDANNKKTILTETNRMAGNLKDMAIAYSKFNFVDTEVSADDAKNALELFHKIHLEPMVKHFGSMDKFIVSGYRRDRYKAPQNDAERMSAILNYIRRQKSPIDEDILIKKSIDLTGVTEAKAIQLIQRLENEAMEISSYHGKYSARIIGQPKVENVEDELTPIQDSEWLYNNMNLYGGISELQNELANDISEKDFDKLLNELQQKQRVSISGDRYTRL